MISKSFSFGLNGLDAYPVTIEVDVGRGLPSMSIVGLPDSAVRESRERVRAAIKNSGFTFPKGRITVNLAPADIKKEGPSFDLPIALGILKASEQLVTANPPAIASLGELSLDGQVKPVLGVLAAALGARVCDLQGLIVPLPNAHEAALAGTVPIFAAATLKTAARTLESPPAYGFQAEPSALTSTEESLAPDFQDVKGQSRVKRGLEVAAAGGHNVLLIGPPGSGKTMMARRFPGILPSMSREEALETTRILSVSGVLRNTSVLLSERPFRTPHHTSSHIALVGGGSDPAPGEATLAHNGVLFMDELPEFSRASLEALRQPMEDGCVTVARASKTLCFPAKFALLAAMNPCPCGYLTDRRRKCSCSSSALHKYIHKISGPLMDRIDIHLDVPALKTTDLLHAPAGESSSDIRSRVERARAIQQERFKKSNTPSNSRMTTRQLKKFCAVDHESETLLKDAIDSLGLSARAHDKILRVARTIADIDKQESIRTTHIAEAVSYRMLDRIST